MRQCKYNLHFVKTMHNMSAIINHCCQFAQSLVLVLIMTDTFFKYYLSRSFSMAKMIAV